MRLEERRKGFVLVWFGIGRFLTLGEVRDFAEVLVCEGKLEARER